MGVFLKCRLIYCGGKKLIYGLYPETFPHHHQAPQDLLGAVMTKSHYCTWPVSELQPAGTLWAETITGTTNIGYKHK